MKVIVLLAAGLTAACTTLLAQPGQPALIMNAGIDSRTELLEVVRAALGNVPLTLADSALTQDSVLIVERVPRYDPNGLLINGRDIGMPERFLLFVQNSRCVLVHERTRQQWYLRHARCKPDTDTGT